MYMHETITMLHKQVERLLLPRLDYKGEQQKLAINSNI